MKKLSLVCTGIVMALVLGQTVLAEGLDLEGVENFEKQVECEVATDNFRENKEERSIFDTGSSDIVMISSDGEYTVLADGLRMTMYPPFGWICVTQDISQQLDTYMSIYKDAMLQAQNLVETNTHFELVDSMITTMVDVVTSIDPIGSLIINSSDLSDADEATVLDMISQNAFPGWEYGTVTLGDSRYYKFVSPEGDQIIYETYVKGTCVDCIITGLNGQAISDEVLSDIEYMLSDFAIS